MNQYQHLKQVWSELLYLTIIFFVILIISGSTKVDASLKLLPAEILETTTFPAYLSLTINCVFYIGVMTILFVIINFITQYHKSEEEYSIFLEGISNVIIALCFFEIIKVAITFMFFDEALQRVTDVELINQQIKGSSWWKYDRMIKIITTIISSLVFFISCYKKKKTMKFLVMATLIFFVGTMLIVLL